MTTIQDAITIIRSLLAPWEDAEGAPVLGDREREKAEKWLRRAEEAKKPREDLRGLIRDAILRHARAVAAGEVEVDERLVEEIASALPTLASLLGELGVVRGAVEFVANQLCDHEEPCSESGGCVTEWCLPCYARAHLSGDAGRRAGEVLRAAAAYDAAVEDEAEYSLAAHRRVTHYTESGDMPRPDGEWRRSEERLEQAQDALLESVRALLAAFPRLRGEVEG